jgi:hypothetical protein
VYEGSRLYRLLGQVDLLGLVLEPGVEGQPGGGLDDVDGAKCRGPIWIETARLGPQALERGGRRRCRINASVPGAPRPTSLADQRACVGERARFEVTVDHFIDEAKRVRASRVDGLCRQQ